MAATRQRAESREQRAEGRGQRAEGRGQRAEGGRHNFFMRTSYALNR